MWGQQADERVDTMPYQYRAWLVVRLEVCAGPGLEIKQSAERVWETACMHTTVANTKVYSHNGRA